MMNAQTEEVKSNPYFRLVRLVQWASRGLADGVYVVEQLPGDTVHLTWRNRERVETVALVYPDAFAFDALQGASGHDQLLLALTHEGYTERTVDGVITGGTL